LARHPAFDPGLCLAGADDLDGLALVPAQRPPGAHDLVDRAGLVPIPFTADNYAALFTFGQTPLWFLNSVIVSLG
jgi:ABC-type glycerol-3-phosphate transport system permease component